MGRLKRRAANSADAIPNCGRTICELLIGISPLLVSALCQEGVIRHTWNGQPGRRGTLRISEEPIEEYLVQAEQELASDAGELKHIRA